MTRERDALRRLLAESARDVIFRIHAGPPPRFEYVSPAVRDVTGYSAEEFYRDAELGVRIVHPDDRGIAADPSLVALPEGQVIRWVRKDGQVIHVESRGTVIRDAAGAVVAFEGIVRDVTARVHAEEALRESEARLRLAMECGGHAYWELDVRRGALRSQGRLEVRPDPAHGGSWTALFHPDDRERALADLEAHVDGRRPVFTAECRIAASDGGWRWVQLSGRATARDETGRATALAGTMTDVTEAKRLQEQLRTADRLAGVGTLAAGVAHEVNNPLAYVAANLVAVDEALAALEGGAPAEPARIAELRLAVRDAMDGAARVRGIVQGLQQFAQPARGEERGPVDVRAEIEAAIGIVRNEIAHRALLRVELPDALPPVRAAPQELGQVLVNLLVNAAQAIPEGRAAENEITVSAHADGDRLVIEVHDTGTGIPAADLPRIFDPFFTTKPVGTGTGLGLAVCHRIVSTIGGTIEVESPPGQGATFRVRLPLLPAESASPPAPARAATAARRGRVLVVDDEALVGKSLARLLSAHDVTALTSPVEVLRRAREGERWDVILCDLMMPEMSGMELEERLQAEAPELVPAIVYLTGGAFTERSRAFLAAGRPHLDKPVDPADLRARVAEVLAARDPSR